MSGTIAGGGAREHFEDAELDALGIDPWKDRGWAGDDLARLVQDLRARAAAIHERELRALVTRHRRSSLEPWMQPVLDRELDANIAYRTLVRVLPIAEQAANAGGRLLFLID